MLVFDIDPSNMQGDVVLSGSNVHAIADLSGIGHAPTLNNDWALGIKQLVFTGSSLFTSGATQFLFSENYAGAQAFACLSGSFAAWTMFIVCQLEQIPAVETAIMTVSQAGPTAFPGTEATADISAVLFVYANASNFSFAAYADNAGASTGTNLGPVDTNAHVLEISADGAGMIHTCLDGILSSSCVDVTPKTPRCMTVGATWYGNPRFALEQLNGKLARVLVFDRNLPVSERSKVRNLLKSQYGLR